MKFAYGVILLSVLLTVSGRATQSSESESASSSKSSSSEEFKHNDESDLMKVDGNTTAEEVKDTEISAKSELKKFDEALEADGKSEGYIQKRTDVRTNGTESLNEEDLRVMDEFEKTMADSEEGHEAQKNETVLGIDTFGAQGI